MKNIQSRPFSFIIILFVYVLALTAGFLCFEWAGGTALFRMFVADIAATVAVFIGSLLLHNASVYDPYWSVAPLAIIPGWMAIRGGELSFTDILLLTAIFVWGIRLTLNWATLFKGLLYQDWRYTMFQQNNPKMWFFINLTGIHLMPTLFVFGGMIPAYFTVQQTASPNVLTFAGFLICILSACIQLISDNQMAQFKKRNSQKSACIHEGLWKLSRHPNYLGEVAFWWGIFILQLSILPQYWFTAVGPVAITLLFVFISIPMMEKHVYEKRPDYAEYQKKVSMLIPWPKKV